MPEAESASKPRKELNRTRLGSLPMLFCLSSGASARYLEDVIRALAMPQGTHLQFRYAKSWLDESTVAKIETRTICGEKAIISYIDQSKPGVTPRIVPCRLAVVRDVNILGHSFCIDLEVTKFAFAKNIESFQQEIRKVDGGNLPHWDEEAGEPKLYGKWFLELSDHFCDFSETDNLKEWENIVKELGKSEDFENKNLDLFFHVVGIGRIDQPGNRVALHDGYYPIRSNTEYQILIYQFQPGRVPENKWLKLTTSERRIGLSSNPLVIIDSRYDLKSIHFNCSGSA